MPGRDEVGAADHERPPRQEDVDLAQAVALEAERRRDVEDGQEQPGQGKADDERAAGSSRRARA